MKSNSKGQSPEVLTKGSGRATTERVMFVLRYQPWVQVYSRDSLGTADKRQR